MEGLKSSHHKHTTGAGQQEIHRNEHATTHIHAPIFWTLAFVWLSQGQSFLEQFA
jgi:hypothetical protein